MKIEIPNDIKSEFNGYNYLLAWLNQFKNVKNAEIEFDFSKVQFFEANLAAIIGVIFEILEFNQNKIKVSNFNRQVETILRKNGFLIPFGFAKIQDQYDTALSYKKFKPNDDEGFNEYIKNELLSKPTFPMHSKKLGKEIMRNIFEIYENARTHGKCEFIHTCGQFFPKKESKPLHFTIVDKGINIKQNVSQFLGLELEATKAIKWAMIKGNTTKTGDTSGGLGLSVIFEFIKLNKGKIQVISSDGFYEFSNGIIETQKLHNSFEGTIVNIRFNLSDDNFYSFADETLDFDNIF